MFIEVFRIISKNNYTYTECT